MTGRTRPSGDYSTVVVHGDQIFVAGMTPRVDNMLVATGRVGRDFGVEEARELAGVAASRAVSAIDEHCGGDEPLVPLSMTVFVNCVDEFMDLSRVADGASEVVARWSGGLLPVRAAVGVQALPQGAPIEVSLIVGGHGPRTNERLVRRS